jgi:hypothetical protein
MTTTLGAPPTTARRPSAAVCVLVGAIVVVGWVLYRHYAFPHVAERIDRWGGIGRFWIVDLVAALLLSVPYAVALLLWGRGTARAIAGATTALVAGLYLWGLDQVFTHVASPAGFSSATWLRVYTWANVLGAAALVPLAWSLARRTRRGWVPGILVGPVVAAILHEMQVHSGWWAQHVASFQHQWSWVLQAVVYVAPFVLAVLACWALEARGRRTPEIGSSA